MKLAPFRLHRASTVEEATGLLSDLGPDALPYCGGTELLLVAKLGLTDFTDLVDLKGIQEMAGIEANGSLRIGALTTHREIERSQVVRDRWPSLAAMERNVGNIRVRNVGTIGGNLCFADPHSDPATYLIAAGATLIARRGGDPPRRIAIDDFTRGPYETVLDPGALLLAVEVPVPASSSAVVHHKMSFHERPAITVAASVTVDGGVIRQARLAVGSIGLAAQRLSEAEGRLLGREADPAGEDLTAACDLAARQAQPIQDANGSVEYKRQLVRVLAGRCIGEALMQVSAP